MPKPFPLNLDEEFETCKETLVELRIGPLKFQVDYLHWLYKALAYAMLIPYLYFAWWLFSPWSAAWSFGSNEIIPASGSLDLEK
jgi:hypothetical protein